MKRISETDVKIPKFQKIDWTLLNNQLHKNHLDEYGFSLGNARSRPPVNLCLNHYFSVNMYLKEYRSKDLIISDLKYPKTYTVSDRWLSHSIDLKKHWADAASFVIFNGTITPIKFGKKTKRKEDGTGQLYTRISQIPFSDNWWYLRRGRLFYFNSTDSRRPLDDFVLLRDLKLDNALPIQKLVCYLATVFHISADLLESIFWGSYFKVITVDRCYPNKDPAQRLIWNIKKRIK
jgi:hypothetical protein